MAVPYKVHSVSFLYTFIFFFFANVLFAQQKGDGVGFLSIKTNFESTYIIIGNDIESAQVLGRSEVLEVEAGKHVITIIPPTVPPFNFTASINPGMYHVATIRFNNTSKNENKTFTQIAKGEIGSIQNFISHDEIDGTFTLNEFDKKDFINYSEIEKRSYYQNTYLKIASNVDTVFVQSEATSKKKFRLANNDSVLIKPGFHRITLSYPYSREYSHFYLFEEEKTTSVQHEFELSEPTIATLTDNFATKEYYNANFIIVSDSDSKIIVNGDQIGQGAVKLNLEPGIVNIDIENPLTGTHHKKIEHTPTENATVIDAYTKPSRSQARFLGILPGVSQLYKKQQLKSALFVGGILVVGGLAVKNSSKYNKELQEFNRVQSLYENTTDEQLAFEYGNYLEAKNEELKSLNTKRKIFWGLTSIIYALNWYDVIFSTPPSGYRTNTNLKLSLENGVIRNKSYSSILVKYEF